MTQTKCPECDKHTGNKQTPTGRDYCPRCGTIKDDDKPGKTKTDW